MSSRESWSCCNNAEPIHHSLPQNEICHATNQYLVQTIAQVDVLPRLLEVHHIE